MELCDTRAMLIVDDEESIRILFQMILAADFPGVQIDVAADGREALEQFAGKHHAVLLMDLHMPVMDGRAAFDAIGELCRTRDWQVPAVVFCTGFAPPDSVKMIVESSPVHGVLTKPVSGRTLVGTVKARLRHTGVSA